MTFNIEELYNKLIDRLYPNNIEKNKKLKEGDPATLRSLVRFVNKGFGSDYIPYHQRSLQRCPDIEAAAGFCR